MNMPVSVDLFNQSVYLSIKGNNPYTDRWAIPDRRARFMKQCLPSSSEIGLMIERVFGHGQALRTVNVL
jgi:hypothetical protein